MNYNDKLELLSEAMDVDIDRLNPEEHLSNFSEWDSLASLTYMSLLATKFRKKVTPREVEGLVTVKDAIDLME